MTKSELQSERPNMIMAGKNLATLCKLDLPKVYIPIMVHIHSGPTNDGWRRTALTTQTNQLIDAYGMGLMMIAQQCGWRGHHQADFVHYITHGDLGWFISSCILGGRCTTSREALNDNQLNLYSKHCSIDPKSEEYGLGLFRFACGVYAGMFHQDRKNEEAQKAWLFAGYHSKQESLWPQMSQEQILLGLTATL